MGGVGGFRGEGWSKGGSMTHSKHGLVTPHFKGNCRQIFVVRLIFIGGHGGSGLG